jgi:predicted lipoprotein
MEGTMTCDVESFFKTIEEATKEFKKLKKHNPCLFPQYNDYCEAKSNLTKAKAELKRTKEIWENL